jgi:hypothetical protein
MTAHGSSSTRLWRLALAAQFLLPLVADDSSVSTIAAPVSVEQIVERMSAADAVRSARLEGYTATRVYQLDNHRFHKQARVTARVTYGRPGEKSFEVISEEGSRLLCDRVLRRVIGAETEASHDGNRELARINFENYKLKALGTETRDGHRYYVLGLEPKSKSPYLIKGQAWIEANEYAVARVEGVVAKKPSIWVGSPVVRQTYSKSGMFWLPEKSISTTDAPMFGKTDLAIESSDYEIRSRVEPDPILGRTGN